MVEGKDLVDAYIAGLSTLPPPPSWGSFNISAAIAHWQTPENPSHIYMARGRELYPGDRADLSGVGYGREYAIFVSRSLRALYTSTYGLAFRQALAVAMVQAGIDLHDRTFNQGGEYYADGGLNNGRWPLVAFAASVLDDDEMLANISGTGAVRGIENKFRWQELGIAYRYEADDVNDRREIIRPSASSAPGTGYQVGDIVTPLNGVALNDTPPTFRVMAVDGAGGITDLDVETQGYYWITPRQEWPDQNSAWPLTGGSGTGAELTLRETQLAHPGLTGQLGWADNIYDRRFPNPVNTSLAQSYRHINLNAALAVAITMRMLPDMQADVDAVDFFALCDALYWNDDGPSGSITPAWVLEDWASYRGFNQTGVPVVTGAETSTDGKLLWLTFDRDLKQSYAARARPADVVVRVNGVVAPRPVDGMHVNGHNVLLLALNTPVAQGDTVTVSYAPGPAPLRFQDLTGNALAAFTDQAVVNMVQ